MRACDCTPTLNDSQVVEFCKNGFLMLEDVVPEEINRRTVEYADANPSGSPTELLLEDWFDEHVIKNPVAAGAVRLLLGRDFALPNLFANHLVECPLPAQEWHFDEGSKWGVALNYLQVFYYPQDCPVEMDPTELLPGSHFLFALRKDLSRLGGIRGTIRAAVPAGSIFITVYSIWHRRSASTAAASGTTSSTPIGAPPHRRETGYTSRASTLPPPISPSPTSTTLSVPPSDSSSVTRTTPPRCTAGSSANRTSSN